MNLVSIFVFYLYNFAGVYVAIVPIIMEQSNPEIITLHNVNFTEVTLKFLNAMQPDKTCLHQKALKL